MPEVGVAPAPSPQGRAAAFVLGGAISSVFSIGMSVVRSKVTALWVGPEGFGVVALVAQVVALGLVACTMAAYSPLVRAMAVAVKEGTDSEDETISGAFWFTVVLHLLGAVAVAIAAVLMLPKDLPISIPIALTLSVVATFGTNITTVASQYFIATANVRVMTLTGMVGAAAGTAMTVPLVWLWRVPGMFWALALGNLTAAAVAWFFLWQKRGRFPRLWPIRSRPGYVKEVLTIGGAGVLGALCLQGQLSAVRWLLEFFGGEAGIKNNGFFQAAWALAGTYLSLVLTGLVSYFSPRMAAATDRGELQKVVDECALYVLRYVAPLALFGICFGSAAILILYSSSFAPGAAVLELLFCSAPLRALGWSYTNTLPMRGHARAYLASELISLAVGIPLQWWAISQFGLNGAGFGIIAQHAIYLPIAVFLQWKASGVSARATHVAAAYGVALAGIVLHFTIPITEWVRVGAVVVCFVIVWRLGVLTQLLRRFRPQASPS